MAAARLHRLMTVLLCQVVVSRGVRRLFSRRGKKILLSDFDQKSLHLPKCLLWMNNNDIIVY